MNFDFSGLDFMPSVFLQLKILSRAEPSLPRSREICSRKNRINGVTRIFKRNSQRGERQRPKLYPERSQVDGVFFGGDKPTRAEPFFRDQ